MDMENTRQSSIGQRAAKRGTQGGKFAFFAVLGLASLTAVATLSGRVSPVAAGTDTSDAASSTNYDFSSETPVDPSDLSVVVSSSSRTDHYQAMTVGFSSLKIITLPNGPRYNNVFVIPDDDTFPGTIDNARAESKAKKEAEGDAYVRPEYDGKVYTIYNGAQFNKERYDAVIPATISYGDSFILNVKSIGANANVDDENNYDYDNLSSITIPSTIESIEPLAFMDVPDTMTIRCELTEEEAKERYGIETTDWTDAKNIEWGVELTSDEKDKLEVDASISRNFGSGKFFLLGIDRKGEYEKPLILEYKTQKINADGSVTPNDETKYFVKDIKNKQDGYDAVQSDDKSFDLNIPVQKNEEIDLGSLKFHNIYAAELVDSPKGGKVAAPANVEEGLYSVPKVRISKVYHIDEYISRKTRSISTLESYTQVSLNVDRVMNESLVNGIFEKINPSVYAANKDAIDRGDFRIRYQFSSLTLASYRVTYRAGNEVKQKLIPLGTPIQNVLLNNDKNNHVGFLFKGSNVGADYSESNLLDVELVNFVLKIDLYNNAKKGIVTKSAVSTRFSAISLIDDINAVRRINVSVIMIVTYIIYLLVFLAGATGYYFFAKNKFKNDEFRRVNGRKYIKSAAKNLFGFALILSSILFIVARWGLLVSSVVTFNPLDVFVILFTIAGGIFLGFAIKNLVNSIKNAKKRREAIRLKLDQDVADDGTK